MKYHVGEEETKPEKEDFYSLILLLQQEYRLLNLKSKCFSSYQNFVRIKYGAGECFMMGYKFSEGITQCQNKVLQVRNRMKSLVCVCVCVCYLLSHDQLCDSMDYSPPDSSVHGILQAKILKWVAIPFSRGSC